MIRILRVGPEEIEAEAILRSVSSELEADTPLSRELEVRAGAEVSEHLQAMGDLPVGAAVISPGGNLPYAFLIHVVLQSAEEPVTRAGLRSALKNGLRRAGEWGLESVAIPPLGTGAGNMDAQEAAAVMVPLLKEYFSNSENPREILIMVATAYEEEVFSRELESTPGQAPA